MEKMAAKKPKLSKNGGGGGGGGGGSEDHLSALPDDLLINILLKFRATAAAARTSVLSRRWRHVWTLLPDLCFSSPADSHCIRSALIANEAPVLRHLTVGLVNPSSDSVAAWLPIAAQLLSGDMKVISRSDSHAAETCTFELPCFENATSIYLDLGPVGVALTPTGVFDCLTDFSLVGVELQGPCLLGDAVSSPRCPSLRRLTVHDAWGLGNVNIHSESLLQMKLTDLHDFEKLTMVAPALKLLIVNSCFHDGSNQTQPVANIVAPQLVSLEWRDGYDPSTVQLGKISHLQYLGTDMFVPYGSDDTMSVHNTHCTELLRQFELIHTLDFILYYQPELSDCEYIMEDIRRLPSIMFLTLSIMANGHSFGACVFHILRMCTGVRKLTIDFLSTPRDLEEEIVCPPSCICGKQPNWKTEGLVLDCLQVIEFICLSGTEHEAAVVKKLFDWATALKTVSVNFHTSITESKADELREELLSLSRPGVCLVSA